MHARHVLGVLDLALGAALAQACAASVESLAPEENVGAVAEADDAFRMLTCKGNHFACMAECSRAGVTCGPAASHPHKPEVGLGYLFGCVVASARNACAFRYKNGDKCFYPKDESAPLCV